MFPFPFRSHVLKIYNSIQVGLAMSRQMIIINRSPMRQVRSSGWTVVPVTDLVLLGWWYCFPIRFIMMYSDKNDVRNLKLYANLWCRMSMSNNSSVFSMAYSRSVYMCELIYGTTAFLMVCFIVHFTCSLPLIRLIPIKGMFNVRPKPAGPVRIGFHVAWPVQRSSGGLESPPASVRRPSTPSSPPASEPLSYRGWQSSLEQRPKQGQLD